MTLDELLLEWSYRSERGYPSVDNPSDVSTLKQILKELNLSEQDVEDVLDNLPDKAGGDDLTHQGTDGMEDSSVEAEKEKQYQDKFDKETKKQSEEEQDLISIIDEEELKNNLRKSFPNYSEDQIEDALKYAINIQCKIPVNTAIQSKDWVINKKGQIDHKQLDEYTEQILKLTKNLTQQDQREWVNYLNNPDRHIAFELFLIPL